jgi:hypothetical protein
MTALFDGMAGILNSVFGAPALYTPLNSGVGLTVQGVFRSDPVEVIGADGHPVLITTPTFRVPRSFVAVIQKGDLVAPSVRAAAGKTFKVLNHLPSGSPAGDAFFLCELEEVNL